MDLARYDGIDGREAAKRLLDDLDIFSKYGNRFYMKEKEVWLETKTSTGITHLTINEILSRTWYVKKPFDVRAEMLARPNEWVGAYKDDGEWHKVGFSTLEMSAVETIVWDKTFETFHSPLLYDDITKCIPIEDVPKEELL